jgi:uncharacterized repeat protein (TIGR03837 family)
VPSSSHWDIFCSVVDNFGDAGIAWRLARILASEHGVRARLYVDSLATLSRLVPDVDAARERQRIGGVQLCAWGGPAAPFAQADPGAVVIEAFGCGLPQSFLAAMAAQARPPLWINLEYLSAEAWIEDCQGLASRHPSLPLTRYFFFPGFTPSSGGLLRERDLFAQRDAWRSDPAARAALWRSLDAPLPDPDASVVSLFCYPHAPVEELLDAWSGGEQRVTCIVPEGVAAPGLERWTGGSLSPGRPYTRGRLVLARVPFMPQDDYDRLLWSCDVNFVRGEDSFVRAQWAARPLVWNVYPQAEDAHRLKLDAFLARYQAKLGTVDATALAALARAWNASGDVAATWGAVRRTLPALKAHAEAWADRLAQMTDLGTALATFCLNKL